MKRICKRHGEVDFAIESTTGYWRCIPCRTKKAMDYRKRKRERLVEMFGGKCSICNYSKSLKALQFHHLDKSTKLFGLSARNAHTKAWDKCVEEAKKCILVCANCHAEVEADQSLRDSVNGSTADC